MNVADKKFEVAGSTVYELEFDSWRRGVVQMRNRLYASVQGSRDTPKEELEAVALLFATSADMLKVLQSCANYEIPLELADLIDAVILKVTGE